MTFWTKMTEEDRLREVMIGIGQDHREDLIDDKQVEKRVLLWAEFENGSVSLK